MKLVVDWWGVTPELDIGVKELDRGVKAMRRLIVIDGDFSLTYDTESIVDSRETQPSILSLACSTGQGVRLRAIG
eukprot:2528778-Rhodomonas_salina.1